MKKLIMVMVIGLTLAATGSAAVPVAVRPAGVAAHAAFVRGVAGPRVAYGGPRVAFGFSYAPAPVVVGYGYPCYTCPGCAPGCYPPAYYTGPVVSVGVVPGGFVRGPAFVGHGVGWRGFVRR